MHVRRIAVLVARMLVGVAFIVAGWAKAIDPWGFVIKIGEYLGVWGLSVPHELVVTAAVALACVEFCTGVMIAVGAFKRMSVLTAAAFMLFMLPLTAYIAIADPVDDCGCFGDFIILSNTATFIKNIVLTGLIVYLLMYNRSVKGLFPVPVQWMTMTFSVAFPLYLAVMGYNVQPLVDFRPFATGKPVFGLVDEEASDPLYYIYEKDGVEQHFSLDALPDSTWTYVDAVIPERDGATISVYDEYGADISAELAEMQGDVLYLVTPTPDSRILSHARELTDLARYCSGHNTTLLAIVGADDGAEDEWLSLVRPTYPVYTAETVSLKMLARGTSALVFVRDGIIQWKRTLKSFDSDILLDNRPGAEALAAVEPVDAGRPHMIAWAVYLAAMLLTYLLGLSPKLLPKCKK